MTIAAAPVVAGSNSSSISPSNYVNIVNGQPWPLNFDPFCGGSGQQCPWNNPLPNSPTLMANSASMISGLMSGGGITGQSLMPMLPEDQVQTLLTRFI